MSPYSTGLHVSSWRGRRVGRLPGYQMSGDAGLFPSRKKGLMTRKLLMTAAIVALALAPSIGSRVAEAHGGGFHGGGFGGGGIHGGGFRDRGFPVGRGFRGNEFRFGGFLGGYYPGYYGYGSCYLTVYGTTYCY